MIRKGEQNEALNDALAAIWLAVPESADDKQQLIAAKCRGLIRGYDARWRDAGYAVKMVERVLTAPLVNPATGKRSRTFEIAGKLDVIAEQYGRHVVIDHKTTSESIDDPNAPYWRQLVVEAQPTHYMLLAEENGISVDGAVWDVIKKPDIRPKKLTKAERTAVVSSRRYFDVAVSQASLDWLQANESESLELYEARLSYDCTHERPERYFQRRPVPRLQSEIIDYAHELWAHAEDIRNARNRAKETQRVPPKSPKSCMMFGSPCRFLGICSGHDTVESGNWTLKSHTHRELGEGVSSEALTNSRIGTFLSCKAKHFYEYEMGIERIDEEEKEALFFGSLLHLGLEAWWNCFVPSIGESSNEWISESASAPTVGDEATATDGTTAAGNTQLAE